MTCSLRWNGKTICEAVIQLANDPKFKGAVLLCAPSDHAADMLALRLRTFFDRKALFRLNSFSRSFAEGPQEILPIAISKKNSSIPLLSRTSWRSRSSSQLAMAPGWVVGHPTIDSFLQLAVDGLAYDVEVEHRACYISEIARFHKGLIIRPNLTSRTR